MDIWAIRGIRYTVLRKISESCEDSMLLIFEEPKIQEFFNLAGC